MKLRKFKTFAEYKIYLNDMGSEHTSAFDLKREMEKFYNYLRARFELDGYEVYGNTEEAEIIFKDKKKTKAKVTFEFSAYTKSVRITLIDTEGKTYKEFNIAHCSRLQLSVKDQLDSMGYTFTPYVVSEVKQQTTYRPTFTEEWNEYLNKMSSFLDNVSDKVFELSKLKVRKRYIQNVGRNTGTLYLAFDGDSFMNGKFEVLDLYEVEDMLKKVKVEFKNNHYFKDIRLVDESY